MDAFSLLLNVHVASVTLSIGLFVLRYLWQLCRPAQPPSRLTRALPPVIDSVLLLSGIGLMVKTHILPLTAEGTWLTEKLFGVIIYVVLGFIALDYRQKRSPQARFMAFLLALVVLYIIIKLAATKLPLLG
ncbi:invasion regulator SirB2 [Intestinirhabdus alba]|jgi:uncharacterized membrane protein SirB2|uniref:SirB family protein n=1 Tax=Intestinirhabdus alba TaxID=2899544 RepID=A0A6L6IK04_9ENTR|nr:invasion regulator SirB2 [Intestinirhabdus alba]MTH46284.1 SirB family protein [Intestinirhabdus alba]